MTFTRIREAAGANDQTRALLKFEMDRLAELTAVELDALETLVAQVVALASRLGCDVPDRLRARADVTSGDPAKPS